MRKTEEGEESYSHIRSSLFYSSFRKSWDGYKDAINFARGFDSWPIRKKKKKEITNVRSLWRERFPNIYPFARQEKMNLNFPSFYVETEEQRNNNDSQNHCFRFTFTRRGESQEEIVKFYKEVNNRQDSRRSVDAANCNYARRSLKRGWEREEHDTRGQREREYDLHRWTVWFLRYPLSLDGEFAPPRTTA